MGQIDLFKNYSFLYEVDWKVYMMTSDRLLHVFILFYFLNQWDISSATVEKLYYKGDLKNQPHLVTFHENILVNLWTFQSTPVMVNYFDQK